jgi:Co/Zn/Cd efflux system component
LISASSFLLFVILEMIGALKSNSLSLLGDAIAMSVDVFTYFANLYAEETKERQYNRSEFNKIVNEIGIPSFSVICLLSVTVYITGLS